MLPPIYKNKKSKSFSSKLTDLGYAYLHKIGSGSFATIHLVFSQSNQKHFVIKKSKSNFGLKNEFELLKKLSHPNIIPIYSLFSTGWNDVLVLEYCPGGSLQQLIDANGPIRPPKLYSFCTQILSAVLYLHQNNIAHLDIKLSNILFDSDGRLKLADFGLSRCLHSDQRRHFVGSKVFMASEIYAHDENYDRLKSDIYSLGVTFYMMPHRKSLWNPYVSL
jgi:polo-like kinase 1